MLVVNRRKVFVLPGPLYTVSGVRLNEADLERILQAFTDVGVAMNYGISRKSFTKLKLIVVLDVLGVLLQVLQGKHLKYGTMLPLMELA